MNKSADSNTSSQANKKVAQEESWSEFLRTILYAIVIAVVFRSAAYEPFNIPSESMLPTLLYGDYLLVSKYSYGYSKHSIPFSPDLFDGRIWEDPPERGDVVVFKRPLDNKTNYIKRIMGLPGDRMQMRGGQLHINGEAVAKERIEDFTFTESPNTHCRLWPQYRSQVEDGTVTCSYPRYKETLPSGKSYYVLDLNPQGSSDNTMVFAVPAGHYFAMGDNRDNSLDSRRPKSVGVGFLPFENMVGRAEANFFSTDGGASWVTPWKWFSAARWERFFTSLRTE